jgi:hypothetical protein
MPRRCAERESRAPPHPARTRALPTPSDEWLDSPHGIWPELHEPATGGEQVHEAATAARRAVAIRPEIALMRERRAGARNAGSGHDPRVGSLIPTARTPTQHQRLAARIAARGTLARIVRAARRARRGRRSRSRAEKQASQRPQSTSLVSAPSPSAVQP